MTKWMLSAALTVSAIFVSTQTIALQLSQYSATQVQKANELALLDKLPQAIEVLERIDSSRPYDKAYINRMKGIIYWQSGELNKALSAVKTAVEIHAFDDEQQWISQKMLADLYFNQQDFAHAIKEYQALTINVPALQKQDGVWLALAEAHYQLAHWDKVVIAIKQYQAHQGQMQVRHYSLLASALIQQKKWQQALPVMKKIIELEPTEYQGWRRLAALEMRLKQEKKALHTLALAKLNGIKLTASDLRLLAHLYAKNGMPELGAKTLAEISPSEMASAKLSEGKDKGKRHNKDEKQAERILLVQQARYWQLAKEWNKAIKAWRQAATFDPQYHWSVAQIYLQNKSYDKALAEIAKVPNLSQEMRLASVRANYQLGDYHSALKLAKSLKDKMDTKAQNQQIEQWIDYLSRLATQADKQSA